MCGRFSIISNSRNIEEHFNLVRSGEFIHSYNVSPSSNIPVVRMEDGDRVLANLHWGLVPHWAKDTKLKPINAKAETVDSKPFFRSAFKKSRCLIPANGFYEWKRTNKHKQPFYFKLKDSELLAFAGLWDHWEHDDETLESCTMITTVANDVMKPVHDRMPVILDPDNYDAWLHEGSKSLLQPYAGKMISYPVSTAVNNPKHNGKDLIEPV
ncbi:MAG: response-associated protein [Gammaproteobacteria bacterium]|nr:response-associated protein [Gammaproteobacteria bacterium]